MKKLILIALLCASTSVFAAQDFNSLLKKAQAGDAISQCNVGYRYFNGIGVPRDDAKAVYWWGSVKDFV